jgi:hypothetical protein
LREKFLLLEKNKDSNPTKSSKTSKTSKTSKNLGSAPCSARTADKDKQGSTSSRSTGANKISFKKS